MLQAGAGACEVPVFFFAVFAFLDSLGALTTIGGILTPGSAEFAVGC